MESKSYKIRTLERKYKTRELVRKKIAFDVMLEFIHKKEKTTQQLSLYEFQKWIVEQIPPDQF